MSKSERKKKMKIPLPQLRGNSVKHISGEDAACTRRSWNGERIKPCDAYGATRITPSPTPFILQNGLSTSKQILENHRSCFRALLHCTSRRRLILSLWLQGLPVWQQQAQL